MERRKALGIIGGLGPAATAYLFSKVVEFTDAACDRDHLDVTVLNRPRTPDRTAFLLGRSDEDFVPELARAARDLVSLGCEVVCMGCVTAHARLHQVQDAVAGQAEVLDLPAEIAADLLAAGCRRTGVLATDGTVETGFLQESLERAGVEPVLPDARCQRLVMSIIYDQVKAGLPGDMDMFAQVCDHLAERGCDSVVLGCTELPLLPVPEGFHGMHVANSLDILARSAVVACGGKLKQR